MGDFRDTFQRDRDRIMYGKAFRRLSGKTQIFVTGYDDHLRTRLTHSLEVAQIAKTIGAFLNLNCHLIEAMAYGHDIGHAPFGHVGERVINYFANGCENYKGFNDRYPDPPDNDDYLIMKYRGFKHNWQSVRILIDTAKRRGEKGLGISPQTLYGILNHTKLYYHHPENKTDECDSLFHQFDENNIMVAAYCKLRSRNNKDKCTKPFWHLNFYEEKYSYVNAAPNFTFEAVVVAISDEIAQRHHDIEDGLRFRIISKQDLMDLFAPFLYSKINKEIAFTDNDDTESLISILSSFIVDYYVKMTILRFQEILGGFGKTNLKDFLADKQASDMHRIWKAFDIAKYIPDDDSIKKFLKNRILFSREAQIMDGRAYYVISRLFHAYISNPQQLPDYTIETFFRSYDAFYTNSPYDNAPAALEDYRKNPADFRVCLPRAHKNGKQDYKGLLLRTICDFVSGMTDRKAMEEFHRLYGVEKDVIIK